MMANLINAIRVLTWVFVMAHSDPKKAKPKPPEPYPLPDKVTHKPADKPGSFAFIARDLIAKTREARKAEADGGRQRGGS